jgi:CheY-like chemotaxis protein
MSEIKVLVVDDDEIVRATLTGVLEQSGFGVTSAANVSDALKHISGPETYDVLLSDLHMPGAGDGLTVVSAMRHANPAAVTLLLSAFPEMTAAAEAIMNQADEILVKPMDLISLIEIIHQRMASGPQRKPEIETVATILERTTEDIIQNWLERVQREESLMAISMSREQRCGHLPDLFSEMIDRLRTQKPIGTKELMSLSAGEHGANRFSRGYTATMLLEEYRMLQISIFHTLKSNLVNIDYSFVLADVMTIADEIDFQLHQSVAGYTREMQLAA